VEADATPENELEHSVSMVLLPIIALELFDRDPPDITYSKYEVLACAALHDKGEIGVSDTFYRKKNHSSIEQERVSYLHQISHLPRAIKRRRYSLYMAQYGDPAGVGDEGEAAYSYTSNSLVFEFIERTGYLLYATGEYQASGKYTASGSGAQESTRSTRRATRYISCGSQDIYGSRGGVAEGYAASEFGKAF
jgi:hypothetical protein